MPWGTVKTRRTRMPFPDGDWRMPATQVADGLKFRIGTSDAYLVLFPYKSAERPHAGGGIWVVLVVNGHPHIIATTHIFVTTPEKVDPTKLGEGTEFYHIHILPQQIVEKPTERHLHLPHRDGWNELDYAVSELGDESKVRMLLCADGLWYVAHQIKDGDVAAAIAKLRATYVSPAGSTHAIRNGAPGYWRNVQAEIAALPVITPVD